MRELFYFDQKDYLEGAKRFVRPSVRAIIIQDNKVVMVYSKLYDYYKFPGGGICLGEDHIQTLIREVREEAGLKVIASTAKAYGHVLRIQKGKFEDIFEQDNFYYFCQVEPTSVKQELDDYEEYEMFTRTLVPPQLAIKVNREHNHGPKDQLMLEREARVLELLIDEGYFNQNS